MMEVDNCMKGLEKTIKTTDMIVYSGLSVYVILPSVYFGGTHMITKIEPGNCCHKNIVYGTKKEMMDEIKNYRR
jgi:hypothetical protein